MARKNTRDREVQVWRWIPLIASAEFIPKEIVLFKACIVIFCAIVKRPSLGFLAPVVSCPTYASLSLQMLSLFPGSVLSVLLLKNPIIEERLRKFSRRKHVHFASSAFVSFVE